MLRVLFCAGVLPVFFESSSKDRKAVFEECIKVFSNWEERYGVNVLGSLDDDQSQIGPSLTYPWTFYALADVPDIDTVNNIVNQLREGDNPLFKYIKIETRIGRAASDIGLP